MPSIVIRICLFHLADAKFFSASPKPPVVEIYQYSREMVQKTREGLAMVTVLEESEKVKQYPRSTETLSKSLFVSLSIIKEPELFNLSEESSLLPRLNGCKSVL